MITRRKVLAAAAGLTAAPLAACEEPPGQSASVSGASAAPPASSFAPASSAGAASSAPAAAPAAGLPPVSSNWTREAFLEAMASSGRPTAISEASFQAIQARKVLAIARIRGYLAERFGQADPRVLAAFQQVPREYYHYLYPEHLSQAVEAYEEVPKPWALGYGSVLSDYLGQAYMTQIAQPKADDVSLEVSTGSGFQSSLLSRIVRQAYTIEIIQPIGAAVDRIFKPLGYDNVEGRVGDGYYGWPEVKDGFDAIIAPVIGMKNTPTSRREWILPASSLV